MTSRGQEGLWGWGGHAVVGTEVAGDDPQDQGEVPAPAWTKPLPITIPIATCSSLIPNFFCLAEVAQQAEDCPEPWRLYQ